MENKTTNGSQAEATATPKKRGRRKGGNTLPATGHVSVSAKLPVDIVRKLDEVSSASFRTRPAQIAFYIAQGLKAEG